MIMKLYKITATLNNKGLSYTIDAYEVTETKLAYKWTGNLIKKSQINAVDSLYRNYGGFLNYFIWSLGDTVLTNKELLKKHIENRVVEMIDTANMLKTSLNVDLGQKIQERNF